eukprot:6204370-Pleurochrysis_carterae.AAC.2
MLAAARVAVQNGSLQIGRRHRETCDVCVNLVCSVLEFPQPSSLPWPKKLSSSCARGLCRQAYTVFGYGLFYWAVIAVAYAVTIPWLVLLVLFATAALVVLIFAFEALH